MQKEAEQSDNENSLINDDAKIGLVSDQKKNLPRSSKSKKYRREGSTVSPVRKESNIINGENIIRSSVSNLKLPSIIPILESAKKPSIKNIAIDRRSVALKIGSTSIKLEQTINKKGDTLPKTRNRSLDNSENSNTTDIISILNEVKQQRRKLLSINEYSSKIKEQMKKYHVDGILDDDNGDDSDDEEFKLSLNEETQIKSILRINTNNSHMASRLYSSIGGTEESMIKVKITDREFKNPFQSFRVLKNNRKVFEDVSKNFLERQEILFEDAIDRLNKQTMHYKVKMPKVKISGIAPKKENNNNILSLEKLQIDEDGNVLAEEEVFTDQIAGKPIPSAAPKEDSNNLNIQLYDDANKLANNLISSSKVPEAKNMELNSSPILSKRKENRRNSAISASTIVQMKNEKFIPKLFVHYKYPKGNFPEGREQFVFFFDTSKIILWGGINSNRSTDVWSLNPLNLEWTKYACQNVYPPNPRYGHSGILFEKKLYVFGGKSKSNNYSYIPDLEYFNTDDHMWTSPNMNSHLQIKLRKNHVCDLIGRQMIIHGGHTEQSEFLSDTHLLNFNPLKWVICNISEHTPGPSLSGHSACLVMPSDIKLNTKFTVYKFPETGINRVNMSKVKFINSNLKKYFKNFHFLVSSLLKLKFYFFSLDQRKRLVSFRWKK